MILIKEKTRAEILDIDDAYGMSEHTNIRNERLNRILVIKGCSMTYLKEKRKIYYNQIEEGMQ